MSRYCKSCNSVLIDDAIICFNCGMRCEYKIKKVGTKIEVEPLEPEKTKPPVKPVVTAEAEKPVNKPAPVKPAEPVNPVKVEKPAEAVKPVEPVNPVKVEKPAELVKPPVVAEQEKPVNKPAPVEPVKPVEEKKPDSAEKTKPVSQTKTVTKINKINIFKYVGLVGIGGAAFFISIIAVIVMIFAMFFTGPQIAVRNFENTINSLNFNENKLAPTQAWRYIVYDCDDYKNISKDEKKEVLQKYYNYNMGLLRRKCGENANAEFEINRNQKVSDKTLNKIASCLYVKYGIQHYNVKEANELKINCNVVGNLDQEDFTIYVYAVKIENRWYMVYYNESENTAEFALNNLRYTEVIDYYE